MNKKSKNISKTLAAIGILVSLQSCSNPFAVSLSSSGGTSGTKSSFADNAETSVANGADYFRKVKNYSGYYSAPSTGNAKMLVVPVVFQDNAGSYTSSNTVGKQIRSDLQTTFFGTAAETNYWESVSSFYTKSSYGKLNISGTITDFIDLPKTVKQYTALNKGSSSKTGGTDEILSVVYSNLFVNNSTYKISDFDSDGDSVIDFIWLVYIYPYSTSGSDSLLWAYTYWLSSTSCPAAKNYSWASYNFSSEGTSSGNDAHTFIHETGHQMGLDDYYSYDDSPTRSPMGRLDMMDYNIGDHCSFTKYDLGWIAPTIGTTGSSYTLKPFEDSGDTLLLALDFNGTPFDEYFLVEYYTPTVLNALDAETPYSVNSFKEFTDYGIRILHVDQRLARIAYNVAKSGWYWDGKYYNNVDPSTAENSFYYTSITSNTKSYCYDSESFCLVNLVQASGKTNLLSDSALASNQTAVNADLFKTTGNVFGKDVFTPSGTANEGWTLPYKAVISDMSTSSVKITLEAK